MPSFVHPLARLWKGFRGQRRPITRPRGARLALQLLEGREVPAGNVVGFLSTTGVLTLTGVNGVGVLSNQNFRLSGGGTNVVIVDGNTADPTTINLGGGPVVYNNVNTVVINLQQGDDTVSFNDIDLPGTVTVNAQSGNNTVIVGDMPGTASHFGNLIINEGGTGSDIITIHNGTHVIDGELRITGGNGTHITQIGTDPGDTTDIGKLTVTGGSGLDVVTTGGDNFAVHGPVTLNYNSGGSSTVFASTIGNTIDGETKINATGGFDSVNFGVAAVESINTQKITLSLGNDGSLVSFFGASHEINGDLTFNAGSGNDQISSIGNNFHVAGKFTVNVGSGGSVVSLGSDTTVAIDGPTAITSGAGSDAAIFGSGGTGDVTLGPVTISSGNDDSVLSFGGLNHSVNGDLTVNNGSSPAGSHVVVAEGDSLSVTGKTTINNGQAVTNIVDLIPASTLDLQGAVKITNTTSDDTAVFGLPGSTTVTMGAGLTISNGPGAGITAFGGVAVAITGDVKITNGSSVNTDVFDSTQADQLFISGALTIANGDGNTQLAIGGNAQGSIGGKFSYSAGTGTDALAISLMDLHEVAITMGNGAAAATFDLTDTVTGNLSIAAGSGGQAVTEDAFVTGNVTITTGSGGDAVSIQGGVGGKLTVSTGGSSDAVTIDNITVGGQTFINTGDGADIVAINGTLFNGTVSILLGYGDDELDIATNAATGFETTFNAAASFGMGPGDDRISIGVDNDDFNRGVFNGAVTFDAGGGVNDQLQIGPPRKNSFAFLPVLLNGWDVVI